MAKRILVTGAGGFIGGFIVAEALKRGYETWAAVRRTTNREFLQDERIHFIELDFTDELALKATLAQAIADNGGKWDYVVHNLGATKAANYLDFERINYGYMRLLVDTLKALDAVPEVFLLMSSLSVMGVGDDEGYTPFKITDDPVPNTRYGMSKAKAETYLKMVPDFPYTIFRCTGVYGPHERDYFLMAKSIGQHIDFSVGYRRQIITFIYVKDLVNAALLALTKGQSGQAYNLSDGGEYASRTFSDLLQENMGVRHVAHICAPLWVLHAVCALSGTWARLRGKTTTLNLDKYRIMKQRNWRCDISRARKELSYEPQYDLSRGVAETVAWYKSEAWI